MSPEKDSEIRPEDSEGKAPDTKGSTIFPDKNDPIFADSAKDGEDKGEPEGDEISRNNIILCVLVGIVATVGAVNLYDKCVTKPQQKAKAEAISTAVNEMIRCVQNDPEGLVPVHADPSFRHEPIDSRALTTRINMCREKILEKYAKMPEETE